MFKLVKGVSLEDADGTKVFLKENGDAAVLDSIGSLIVASLIEGDMDSCVNNITRDYNVEKEEVRKDVVEFAEKLLSLGLLEAVL